MKKQLIKIVLSLLLGVTIAGCNDWLTLKPENDIVLDEFWKKEADVEAVLATCYKSLTERSAIERMMVWGELRSDNIVPGYGFAKETYDMYKILIGNLKSDNAYASWAPFYATINYCNTLLYNAPNVVELDENFTDTELELLRGEVITLRALAYFYLVRAFRDIPWTEEPGVDDSQNYSLPKLPEAEVLDHIIADLEYVKNARIVRESYASEQHNKGRITKSAMLALLADVYLWKGDYAKCIENCSEVLRAKDLGLIANGELMYNQIFYRKNSKESIFELQFSNRDMVNTAVNDLYSSANNPFGSFAFPAPLAYIKKPSNSHTGPYSPFNYKLADASFESEDDLRSKFSYCHNVSPFYTLFKYAGVYVTENITTGVLSYYYRTDTPNWIVYRLSDVMLMKAEALVQLESGNIQQNMADALELVNTTYMRSNPKATPLDMSNYASKSEMERLVLRERHRELLFEGKRWFDLVRLARRAKSVGPLNSYVTVKMDATSSPIGAVVMDAMYMPIPKRELEMNKNLVQNPFYVENESSHR